MYVELLWYFHILQHVFIAVVEFKGCTIWQSNEPVNVDDLMDLVKQIVPFHVKVWHNLSPDIHT